MLMQQVVGGVRIVCACACAHACVCVWCMAGERALPEWQKKTFVKRIACREGA
mgnify:CR=1 FL=1